MSIPVLGGIDPGRVAAIELASDQAKKTIPTSNVSLMTIWINSMMSCQ